MTRALHEVADLAPRRRQRRHYQAGFVAHTAGGVLIHLDTLDGGKIYVRGNIYGDLPRQEALDFEYRVLDYRERSYEQIPFSGLSADYVLREAKRAVASMSGAATVTVPVKAASWIKKSSSSEPPETTSDRSTPNVPLAVAL